MAAGGRRCSGAAAHAPETILLNEPGSLFGERWDQLDINFKKNIRYGNKVHSFQLDLFNVLNSNAVRTDERRGRRLAWTG